MYYDGKTFLKSKGSYSSHFYKMRDKIKPMIKFLLDTLRNRFQSMEFLVNFDCLNIEHMKKLN